MGKTIVKLLRTIVNKESQFKLLWAIVYFLEYMYVQRSGYVFQCIGSDNMIQETR